MNTQRPGWRNQADWFINTVFLLGTGCTKTEPVKFLSSKDSKLVQQPLSAPGVGDEDKAASYARDNTEANNSARRNAKADTIVTNNDEADTSVSHDSVADIPSRDDAEANIVRKHQPYKEETPTPYP